MRMRKSAKNDNNIRESDRQELTSLYRYVPRETEKIRNAASKKNHALRRTCKCRKIFLYHWHMKTVIYPLYTYFFWYISYNNMNNRRMEKNSTDGD